MSFGVNLTLSSHSEDADRVAVAAIPSYTTAAKMRMRLDVADTKFILNRVIPTAVTRQVIEGN